MQTTGFRNSQIGGIKVKEKVRKLLQDLSTGKKEIRKYSAEVIKAAQRAGFIYSTLIHSIGYVAITTAGEDFLKGAK